MSYLKEIGIEQDLNSMSIEEILLKIREFNQYSIYTVNKYYCIQLFDLEVCGNDEIDCISEFSDTVLRKVLIRALEDISETIYNRNHDF